MFELLKKMSRNVISGLGEVVWIAKLIAKIL
jgi:hypothetical protein